MRLRARLAVVAMLLLVLLGLGAGAQANAKPPVTTPNNGCVVVPPLELAACLGRL